MGDGGKAALDHCLPSTISWLAGEAGKGGEKASNSKPGSSKDLQKGFFFSFPSFPGVSKQALPLPTLPRTQQLLFIRRNGEARTDAMSIAKGKTPARHTYLFTVQEEQMDKEGKEEKGERGEKGS